MEQQKGSPWRLVCHSWSQTVRFHWRIPGRRSQHPQSLQAMNMEKLRSSPTTSCPALCRWVRQPALPQSGTSTLNPASDPPVNVGRWVTSGGWMFLGRILKRESFHNRKLGSLVGQHCANQIGLPPICRPTNQSWKKKTRRTFQPLTATYLIHSHLREG